MGLLKYFIVFFLVSQTFAIDTSVSRAFKRDNIVPNVLNKAPPLLLEIAFGTTNGMVRLGNTISISLTERQPSIINFDSNPRRYYTYIFLHYTNVLSGTNPRLVALYVNVLGIYTRSGTTLARYQAPDQGVGNSRSVYIYLVYSQSGRLNFNESPITRLTDRLNFSLERFLRKYKLRLYAGNYHKTSSDDEETSSDDEETSSREEETSSRDEE